MVVIRLHDRITFCVVMLIWHMSRLGGRKQAEKHSSSKNISISKDLVFVGMGDRERKIRETSLHQTSPLQ